MIYMCLFNKTNIICRKILNQHNIKLQNQNACLKEFINLTYFKNEKDDFSYLGFDS